MRSRRHFNLKSLDILFAQRVTLNLLFMHIMRQNLKRILNLNYLTPLSESYLLKDIKFILHDFVFLKHWVYFTSLCHCFADWMCEILRDRHLTFKRTMQYAAAVKKYDNLGNFCSQCNITL